MKRLGGFTLIEALLTLALTATILGMAAGLMQEYSRQMRFASLKNSDFLILQVALDRVGSELRGSSSLLDPAPSVFTPSSDLRYQQIACTYPGWLPSPMPAPGPTGQPPWNPSPAGSVREVHVYRDARQILMREVGPPGGPVSNRFVLAQQVSAFNATNLPEGTIKLSVAVQETDGLKTYTTKIVRTIIP